MQYDNNIESMKTDLKWDSILRQNKVQDIICFKDLTTEDEKTRV